MALESYTSDVLIMRLGWRADHILNSMISIHGPVQTTVFQCTSESSNTGPFDALPLELMHYIFNLLDFRSLSHFARVCRRGRTIVESLPAYRDLVKHTSTALIALHRTKLITFHSAASIYAALLSENCVSCKQFAPFLFLPTCERCCYECLYIDRSLRVISGGLASRCFGVSPRHLCRIPSMVSIPGTYSVGHEVQRKKRVKLVSLKQARELGIAIHGSEEAMNSFVTSQNTGKLGINQMHAVRWLTVSFSESETHHPSMSTLDANVPNDPFCGMASTVFPALRPNNLLENGIWCLECQINFRKYSRTRDLDNDDELLFSGTNPLMALLGLERRARSKTRFIEHVRECKGAKELLRELEHGIKSS